MEPLCRPSGTFCPISSRSLSLRPPTFLSRSLVGSPLGRWPPRRPEDVQIIPLPEEILKRVAQMNRKTYHELGELLRSSCRRRALLAELVGVAGARLFRRGLPPEELSDGSRLHASLWKVPLQ